MTNDNKPYIVVLSHTSIPSIEPRRRHPYLNPGSHGRDDDGNDETPILAESSLCTVLRSDERFVSIQINYVIVCLPERDVASLAGGLNRVLKQLFRSKNAPSEPRGRAMLRVIEGGAVRPPEQDDKPAIT